MRNSFLLIVTFVCCLSKPIQAQQKWALADCIHYASTHNTSLQMANLNVSIEEYTLKQKRLDLLPSLNGNASYAFNIGRVVDPTTYNFVTGNIQTNNFGVSSNLNLFSGFQKQNAIKQQAFKLESSKAANQESLLNLDIQIANDYLQVLMSRENVKIAEDQLHSSKGQQNFTQKLVTAGKLPEGDLLDINSKVASDQLSLVNAKNQETSVLLNLRIRMNLPSGEAFDIITPSDQALVNIGEIPPLEAVIQKAALVHPSIMKAQYNMHSAEKGLDIAKGSYYPSLDLFANWGTNYSNQRKQYELVPRGFDTIGTVLPSGEQVIANFPTFDSKELDFPYMDQLKNDFNQVYGISLRIPIFNNFQSRSLVETARVQYQIADLNFTDTRNQLENTIQQVHANALAAKSQFEASQKNVEAMENSFKYARIRAEQGMLNSLDFITAQNNFNMARAALLQAKYELLFSLMILDIYQGKPIQNLN